MVFHPGHDELHGITVIISGASGRTYVGRWHERGNRGVTMRDVAIHDPATTPVPLDAWLAKQLSQLTRDEVALLRKVAPLLERMATS